MSEIDRTTLTSMGLALCDELSECRVGWRGRLQAEEGYQGDTFLDKIAPHFAPDVFDPNNILSNDTLEWRLRTAVPYLRALASRGALDPGIIEGIMNLVDMSALGDRQPAAPTAKPEYPEQPALFPLNQLVVPPLSA